MGDALIALTEVWLGGESAGLACARKTPHGWSAWALMMGFTLTTVVCLLNMLIAQMAKTFDTVWDARTVSYLHSRAQIVQRARTMPLAPPPLNLLGLPALWLTLGARAARTAGGALRGACQRRRASASRSRLVGDDSAAGAHEDHVAAQAAERAAHERCARMPPPGAETVPVERARLDARVDALDERIGRVMERVEARLDDVSAEDRWRVAMLNRMRSWIERLDATIAARVDAVHADGARLESSLCGAGGSGSDGGGGTRLTGGWAGMRHGRRRSRARARDGAGHNEHDTDADAADKTDGGRLHGELGELRAAVAQLQHGQAELLALLGSGASRLAVGVPVRGHGVPRAALELAQPARAPVPRERGGAAGTGEPGRVPS